MKNFWRLFLAIALLTFFHLPSPVHALVCTSPRKGVAGAPYNSNTAQELGIRNGIIYSPHSWSQDVTPMLTKGHIGTLRAGGEQSSVAGNIRQTIHDRGTGGYWLIFNEPMGVDGYPSGKQGASDTANDAAFAISFIKNIDPTAKFIVGWYYFHWHNATTCLQGCETSIYKEWQNVITAHPEYHLSSNMNDEIAGWSVHYIDAATIAAAPPAWPLRLISPGKEIWVTEFGALGNFHCTYDKIDTDANQTCVNDMKNQVNAMENSPYVTKYFWWNYGLCDPDCLTCGQTCGWMKDECYGPLTKLTPADDADIVCEQNFTGQTKSLNNLGQAFAAIPNDNGACRYSLTTPTPIPPPPTLTPIPPSPTSQLPSPTPTPIPGDVNGDGHVNMADYSLFVSKYGTNDSSCDFNKNGIVDMGDYSIIVANYGR